MYIMLLYSIYVYIWHIIYIMHHAYKNIMPYTSNIRVHIVMAYTCIDVIMPYKCTYVYICHIQAIYMYIHAIYMYIHAIYMYIHAIYMYIHAI